LPGRSGLRWLWSALVTVLVVAAIGAGWVYTRWEPQPPPPAPSRTDIKPDQPVQGPRAEGASPRTGPLPEGPGQGGHRVTLAIAAPGPALKNGPVPAREEAAAPAPIVSARIPAGEGTGQAPPAGQPAPDQSPEGRGSSPGPRQLTLPPPQVVPPFSAEERPVFILETERQGQVINVRGTTNLAVEGNGIQVSLFRIFREADEAGDKRASLAARNLALWFEGRFQVDDEAWLTARARQVGAYAGVFPAVEFLDRERVYVEVLFTASREEVGPVPGLTVHPIPGSEKQVYRIIRPVNLPLGEAGLSASAAKPGPSPQTPPSAGPRVREDEAGAGSGSNLSRTEVKIIPLVWLDGPRKAEARLVGLESRTRTGG